MAKLTTAPTLALAALAWVCQLSAADEPAERPVCWLTVPHRGRAAALLDQGAEALRAAGFEVAAAPTGRAPAVLVVYPGAISSDPEIARVHQLADDGAGLVVVYSAAPALREITEHVLAPWQILLRTARSDTGDVVAVEHWITRGLDGVFSWRVPVTLEGVRPLLRQGENVIAGRSTRGGRRLVVLPIDAIVPGQPGDRMPETSLTLLVRAAAWAARQTRDMAVAVAVAEQPGEGAPQSQPQRQPEAVAYVDIAAEDENWAAIRQRIITLLGEAGLEVRKVRVSRTGGEERRGKQRRATSQATELPLVRAVAQDPDLIVVGSCRKFDELEVVTLGAFVRSGAALLVLPRATHRTNMRMVHVNEILTEFGMIAVLGRPAGKPKISSEAPLEVHLDVKKLPGGVFVVGSRGLPVVTVDDRAAIRVSEVTAGRVAVADPLPLLDGLAGPQVARRWREVLISIVRWLISRAE